MARWISRTYPSHIARFLTNPVLYRSVWEDFTIGLPAISEYLTKFRSTSLDLYLADRRQSNKFCGVETPPQSATEFGYLAGTFFFSFRHRNSRSGTGIRILDLPYPVNPVNLGSGGTGMYGVLKIQALCIP